MSKHSVWSVAGVIERVSGQVDRFKDRFVPWVPRYFKREKGRPVEVTKDEAMKLRKD